MPNLIASRHGKRPIEEIAKVSEDLGGSARFVTDGKAGKGVGRAAQSFASTIGNSGHGMTQELAGGVGRFGHAVIPFSLRITNKSFNTGIAKNTVGTENDSNRDGLKPSP